MIIKGMESKDMPSSSSETFRLILCADPFKHCYPCYTLPSYPKGYHHKTYQKLLNSRYICDILGNLPKE